MSTRLSARNHKVGIGGVIEGVGWISNDVKRREYDRTIGTPTQVNAYTAALASIEVAAGIVAVARAVDRGNSRREQMAASQAQMPVTGSQRWMRCELSSISP